MKNKGTDRFLKIFLYIGLIGIGIVAGIAIRHYNNMPLSETINIIDIATLVTTVFLAVYIPEVLDRKLQITRDKKELLEQHVLEYQTLLRRVNMLVQDDSKMTRNDFLTMHNSMDVAEGKLESLGRLLKYAKLGNTFPEEMEEIKKMNAAHRKILKYGDGQPVASYPADVRKQEGDLYNRIDEATTLLIFKISDIT